MSKYTLTLTDGNASASIGVLTGSGPTGAAGADGTDGLGWTGGSYDNTTGVVTFTSDDGLGFATDDIRGTDGTDGLGWTSVTYDNATGQFTFTSDDGLGYVSESITADLDAAVAAAEAAKTATEDLFDQFGDQYLGPLATDPTTDNDGDPLDAGDIYYNTTESTLKFYTGSEWTEPDTIATEAAAAAEASAGLAAGYADSASFDYNNTVTQAAAAAASATAAATSETNAATSETNAATSETNAATSETNAAASETAAAASATAAAASETTTTALTADALAAEANAQSYATAAATSATNAATSETNADQSAIDAANSASNASLSATEAANYETGAQTAFDGAALALSDAQAAANAAGTSETNAATSETNAATSATNAATSATAAAASATNAATSATDAAASATSASFSVSDAQGYASDASTSASNAETSATNALNYADSASTYASNANTSANNAAESYDNFDDRYLGDKTADPTVDNDGDPLLTGALYFNTVSNAMKVYDGSAWQSAYVSLSGALLAANDLSDLSDPTAALTNLNLSSTDDVSFQSATLANTDNTNLTLDYTEGTNAVGSFIEFYRDGSYEGAISSGNSGFTLLAKLGFGLRQVSNGSTVNAFYPTNAANTGVLTGVVDLGYPTSRFKDVWSSGIGYFGYVTASSGITAYGNSTIDGTLKIGGASAANEMSEYEEGTYTPVLTGASSGTATLNVSFDTLNYTKVGRLVTVSGKIVLSLVGSGSGSLRMSLPFTPQTSTEGAGESGTSFVWTEFGLDYVTRPLTATSTDVLLYVNYADLNAGDALHFDFTYPAD